MKWQILNNQYPISASLPNCFQRTFGNQKSFYRMRRTIFLFLFFVAAQALTAQNKDAEMVQQIVREATENSQLKTLGHQLMDGIGPRLVGTPKMKQAHDWAVDTY